MEVDFFFFFGKVFRQRKFSNSSFSCWNGKWSSLNWGFGLVGFGMVSWVWRCFRVVLVVLRCFFCLFGDHLKVATSFGSGYYWNNWCLSM